MGGIEPAPHSLFKVIHGQDMFEQTALHLAATNNRLDASRELLSRGASPHRVDMWGRKPVERWLL